MLGLYNTDSDAFINRMANGDTAVTVRPALSLAVARFRLAARQRIYTDVWPGALWRGVLGRALRQQACLTGAEQCNGCQVRRACHYAQFFEGVDMTANGSPVPGYTLAARWRDGGRRIDLQLCLIGGATRFLTDACTAVARAASDGIGKQRVPLALIGAEVANWHRPGWRPWRVNDDHAPVVGDPLRGLPDVPSRVRVLIDSPWRLIRDRALVGPDDLNAGTVSRSILQRFYRLSAADGDESMPLDDLVQRCERLSIPSSALRWQSARRYSARQRATLPLDGIVGHFDLAGPALATLWPWLWVGQWIHVGKGTTSGLGAYHLNLD